MTLKKLFPKLSRSETEIWLDPSNIHLVLKRDPPAGRDNKKHAKIRDKSQIDRKYLLVRKHV